MVFFFFCYFDNNWFWWCSSIHHDIIPYAHTATTLHTNIHVGRASPVSPLTHRAVYPLTFPFIVDTPIPEGLGKESHRTGIRNTDAFYLGTEDYDCRFYVRKNLRKTTQIPYIKCVRPVLSWRRDQRVKINSVVKNHTCTNTVCRGGGFHVLPTVSVLAKITKRSFLNCIFFLYYDTPPYDEYWFQDVILKTKKKPFVKNKTLLFFLLLFGSTNVTNKIVKSMGYFKDCSQFISL